MDDLLIKETEHTTISQAYGFRVPGYVIAQPKAACSRLADLAPAQLVDLAECLARAESLVAELVSSERTYVLKFGESDQQIHFHVVPRTAEIESAYIGQVPDAVPYSGARLVDWLWFNYEQLGYSDDQVREFASRARGVVQQADATDGAAPRR